MEELNQFLNSVEASARRILKQQHKKQQELAVRDRVALVRSGAKYAAPSPSSKDGVSRDELRASYGSLIVAAPAPHKPPDSPAGRRSEHASEPSGDNDTDDDNNALLPRLPQSSGAEPLRSVAPTGSFLPALDKSHQQQQQLKKDAATSAIEAAKRANRDRRASTKILASPLYKSLAKGKSEAPGFGSPQALKKALHDADHVGILLRKMGLRNPAASPSQRPDHAVERRMCNACWAQPHKLTGCEHHGRVMPAPGSQDAVLQSLELQGPKSWLSDDLFVKYRSESDREALWAAFQQLQDAAAAAAQASELGGSPQALAVIPVVTRHPIVAKCAAQLELENLRTLAATRRRNQSKAFVFDVNHLWLTNLDHFSARALRTTRRQQQRARADAQGHDPVIGDEDDDDPLESQALSDRRDEAAIAQGYSQIQSISTARALQHAIFPEYVGAASSRGASATSPAGTSPQRRANRRKRPKPSIEPLSLFICGRWRLDAQPDPRDLVPGVAITGACRVLWWRYAHDEDDADELTKVVAMFARDAVLSSSNAILVSVVLALDAPVLAPRWFAWHVGSRAPPPTLALVSSQALDVAHTPCRVSHCTTSLVRTPLQSRLDALLPSTIVLLNTAAEPSDHVLQLDEPYGHRRLWPEFTADAFRQWWRVRETLPPNYTVIPQGCSVLAAQPNAPGVCGRFCWHAPDAVREFLIRRRAERDYVYIVHNDRPCGSNTPMYVAVSMAHEAMVGVHAAKLSTYLELVAARQRQRDYEAKLVEIEHKLEVGRLVLEAKRQEQKRIEQELAAAAATRDAHGTRDDASALEEWDARLRASVVRDEQNDWQQREITTDGSQVLFYYALNAHLPPLARFSWTRPATWHDQSEAQDNSEEPDDNSGALTDRSDASSTVSDGATEDALTAQQQATNEAVAQLTRALLEDEQFLSILKDKLGLPALAAAMEDQSLASALQRKPKARRRSSAQSIDDASALQLDWDDQFAALTEESECASASLMARKMAKLQLAPAVTSTAAMAPGAGWKRLKVSKLPRNFARSVYAAHTEGPRSAFINQPNHATPVGMLDPAEASAYEVPEFIPELRALLVPKANADLQEKKAIWAEYERLHRPRVVAGVASGRYDTAAAARTSLDELLEGDPAESQLSMEARVTQAILFARNNNLEGLENALDGGVDVNARDNYGNTLFILVCQQGNKRLAKLLLRRRADMNLQVRCCCCCCLHCTSNLHSLAYACCRT